MHAKTILLLKKFEILCMHLLLVGFSFCALHSVRIVWIEMLVVSYKLQITSIELQWRCAIGDCGSFDAHSELTSISNNDHGGKTVNCVCLTIEAFDANDAMVFLKFHSRCQCHRNHGFCWCKFTSFWAHSTEFSFGYLVFIRLCLLNILEFLFSVRFSDNYGY